jgi:hypothetical protein
MRPMLLAVITAASVSLPTLLPAQQSDRLTQRRVLEEAVSSYSDTGQFFVVAATTRPFTVLDYFRTRAAADSAAASKAGYSVFGPYRGPAARDPWLVLSITVRVRTDSGERELHYDPRTVDAIFLTMSAVRKFMLPYYRGLYGNEYVEALSAAIGVPTPPTPPCHRMSFPCTSDSLLWVSPRH